MQLQNMQSVALADEVTEIYEEYSIRVCTDCFERESRSVLMSYHQPVHHHLSIPQPIILILTIVICNTCSAPKSEYTPTFTHAQPFCSVPLPSCEPKRVLYLVYSSRTKMSEYSLSQSSPIRPATNQGGSIEFLLPILETYLPTYPLISKSLPPRSSSCT